MQVRLEDQAAILKPVDAERGSVLNDDLLDMLEMDDESAETLSLGGLSSRFHGPSTQFLLSVCGRPIRKCRAIAEMLIERAILKDALPHDRVLSGAKNLLLKYALGG